MPDKTILWICEYIGCKHGTFGTGCINQCSKNCLNNVPCNSIHGHCESGCASGYLDVFCNKSKIIVFNCL